MSPPVIIDAGPSLNFFAANQERLLIGVVGPLAMPRTVHDEIANKTARDKRFSAAAGVLRKIRGTQFLAILEDDYTSALDNVVHRLTGAPLEERRSLPKDLGEIMVIAHAVVMAESGADVRVVIDDGYGARLAAREAQRLERLKKRQRGVGCLSLVSTEVVLEAAVSRGLIKNRGEMRRLYDRLRQLDDGLVPIESTSLLDKRLWGR